MSDGIKSKGGYFNLKSFVWLVSGLGKKGFFGVGSSIRKWKKKFLRVCLRFREWAKRILRLCIRVGEKKSN